MVDALGCLLIEAEEASPRARSGVLAVEGARDRDPGRFARSDTSVATVRRPLAIRPLAGKPLVDWVLRRASDAELLQAIVVILPTGVELGDLKQNLPSGVSIFETDSRD